MPATALSRSQLPLVAPSVAKEISLAEFLLALGDTRLPAEAALYVLGSIARAVSDAHEAGRVHGRLEPSNVVLSADGKVRVEFPRAGARLVPAYSAPELKPTDTPDVLCDVYSIGAIAYELLTGRLVPAGQAQPPSAFNPGVDPTVDELVLCAIDREPDQRPYTARALMSAVAHCFREMDLQPNPAELARLISVFIAEEPPAPLVRTTQSTATPATTAVRVAARPPGRPQPARPAPDEDDEEDERCDTGELQIQMRPSKTPWLVAAVLIIAASAGLWIFTRGSSRAPVADAEPEVSAPVHAASAAPSVPVRVKKIVTEAPKAAPVKVAAAPVRKKHGRR